MILINMKMPESCGVCKMHFLGDPDYICCQITDRIPKIVGKFHNSRINLDARKASIESVARPDWCPLIEVSEHGRLIDADKLGLTDFEIVMCDGSYKKVLEMLAKKIEDAPTVIPADKDGET